MGISHRPLRALLVCQEVGEHWPPPPSHLDLVSSDLYQVGVISYDSHLCGHQDEPQGRYGTNQKEAIVGRGGEGDAAHYHVILLPARTPVSSNVNSALTPNVCSSLPLWQVVTYTLSRGAGSSSDSETPSSSSNLKTSPARRNLISWDFSKNRECQRKPT